MTPDSLAARVHALIADTSQWDIYRGSADVQQFVADVRSRLEAALAAASETAQADD